MTSKKNDVSNLEFTGKVLASNPPQYVYEGKDGSRVNSKTPPSDDQVKNRSTSMNEIFKNFGSEAGSPIDKFLNPADRKKLRDQTKKKAPRMAKGGAMKTKGGVKRNMRPPSGKKSGLYGR